MAEGGKCPFCPFKTKSYKQFHLHIDEYHPEKLATPKRYLARKGYKGKIPRSWVGKLRHKDAIYIGNENWQDPRTGRIYNAEQEASRHRTIHVRKGYHKPINGPVRFLVGEAGPERVDITPVRKKRKSSGMLHSSGIKMPRINIKFPAVRLKF